MYIICMPKKRGLSPSERERFTLIARAAYANPFGSERDDLDARIIGESAPTDVSLRRVLAAVSGIVTKLAEEGRARLDAFEGEDRALMEKVFLFDAFHLFMEEFDSHIVEQERSGGDPLPVPFASDALTLLAARDFTETSAIRYFEIFFQLRRAFHFIQRRIAGISPSMRRLRMNLWNNVFTHDLDGYDRVLHPRMEDFSTMLLGETGTGKGAAAAAIGRSGLIPFDPRRGRFAESFTHAFVAINLSQFAETIIESELFGHRKGAFTGAVETHQGVFSRCSPHGAIFLDEIAEVSVPIQIKLLKVLEERVFTPLGSHEVHRFEGRVIVATNRPLNELRRRGEFRDELFYRVCSDIIHFPPLRDRIAESPEELRVLVETLASELTGGCDAEREACLMDAITAGVGAGYAWPGNVRELSQCLRRILLTGAYGGDRMSDEGSGDGFLAQVGSGALDAETLLAGYAARLFRTYGTYEEVARRMKVDRRTAAKYVRAGTPSPS